MNSMKTYKNYKLLALSSLLIGNASAQVIIQNDFNGLAVDAGDIGPAIQQLSNGVNGSGAFNSSTGAFTNTSSDTNASGFNSSSLVALDPLATEITATFVISSTANASAIQSNGFFLGIVTGAGATDTDGGGLFNNDPLSFGFQIFDGGGASLRVVRDGFSTGDNILFVDTPLSAASVEDGFTVELVLRDGSFDAFTTGLLDDSGDSIDLNLTNQALPTSAALPDFNDFLTGGVGINGTIQGNASEFTIASATVEVEVVPEPSSTALLGLGGLALLARRKRA